MMQLAEESLGSILRALNILPIGSLDISGYNDLQHLRIRLTEYSKVELECTYSRSKFKFF
ncbi:hypothetical protein TSUD_339250 [Trifolium subterraneum]|nr:hypothetical protein TSUD_339250 [Trifolium subterraneum]